MPPKMEAPIGLKEWLAMPENEKKRLEAIAKNKAVREARAMAKKEMEVKPEAIPVKKKKLVRKPKPAEDLAVDKPEEAKVAVKKSETKKLNIPTISSIPDILYGRRPKGIHAELDTFSIEIFTPRNNPRATASKQELHNEYIHFTKDIQKYYTEDEFKQIMTYFTSRKFRVYCFYIPSKDRKSGLVIMQEHSGTYFDANRLPLIEDYEYLPFITTYIPELDTRLRTFEGLSEYGYTVTSRKKVPLYPPNKFQIVRDFIKTNTGIEI